MLKAIGKVLQVGVAERRFALVKKIPGKR